MVDDIEQRVIELVTRHSGMYIFRKKRYDTYTAESNLHFDVRLDVDDTEELMDAFFTEFNVERGNFNIGNYYPEIQCSWNRFRKQVVDLPDFTIGMLIESAKAGRWLYD